ncbi:type II restriction endonuclease [Fusobacterium pseudoperiodonticum]|nr:type II restriction endonuclease [Fusobacterium pseudoperiodonticum]
MRNFETWLKNFKNSIATYDYYIDFEKVGFKLKEIIIKEQHNCKATGYWKPNSVNYSRLTPYEC